MEKPNLIPIMPDTPVNGEPRNSFSDKAIKLWQWLKEARVYFNNILEYLDWGVKDIQENINYVMESRVEVLQATTDIANYKNETKGYRDEVMTLVIPTEATYNKETMDKKLKCLKIYKAEKHGLQIL